MRGQALSIISKPMQAAHHGVADSSLNNDPEFINTALTVAAKSETLRRMIDLAVEDVLRREHVRFPLTILDNATA